MRFENGLIVDLQYPFNGEMCPTVIDKNQPIESIKPSIAGSSAGASEGARTGQEIILTLC